MQKSLSSRNEERDLVLCGSFGLFDEDLAVRLVVEGAKQVQEGALAAAGFAEDEDEAGRGQGEGNVDEPAGKGVLLADVGFLEMLDLNHGMFNE